MPVHDWTRVEPGIFHDFHHEWISTIRRSLNDGVLPDDYYALAEQQTAGFGPDVLTLQSSPPDGVSDDPASGPRIANSGLLLAPPRVAVHAQASDAFHHRRKSTVVVRHISGDRIVAVVEILSPGNKSSRHAFQALLHKAVELLELGIHLLIVDLFPPTPRDPQGVHAALWEELTGTGFAAPDTKILTLASYESSGAVDAFVEPIGFGDTLIDMPLFLAPGGHVPVPLEATYRSAFSGVPARWRRVLETSDSPQKS